MDSFSDNNYALIIECFVSNLDSHENKSNVEILAVQIPNETLGPQRFESACVDSGSQQHAIE